MTRSPTTEQLSLDRGLALELADGTQLVELSEINDALQSLGARCEPLDLSDQPEEVKSGLRHNDISDTDRQSLVEHFLLSREDLLAILSNANRSPAVPGGGALTTFVTPHNYSYPAMWVVQGGEDYSRFDRFHVNVAEDGTPVDEVIQLVSGAGFSVLLQQQDGSALTLWVSCSDPNSGWIVTYNGGHPHQGRLSTATAGTKALVQVIGPERFEMRYDC